jgi:hypothetical protein
MSLWLGTLGSQITTPPLLVQYLIVAGGGGAGGALSTGVGGAGGAGGFRTSVPGDLNPPDKSMVYVYPEFRTPDPQFAALTNTPYTITVGAGGSAGALNSSQNGASGSNSRFASVTIFGGGGGGFGPTGNGLDGGSGGGGGGGTTNTSGGGRAERQGSFGGIGRPTSPWSGQAFSGAGGGAGGYGNQSDQFSGSIPYGGNPMPSSLGGYLAGGGSGGNRWDSRIDPDWQRIPGPASPGGGLDIATGSGIAGVSGGTNTGYGGGGSGGHIYSGGNGGSGIVLISIPSFYTASFSGGVTQTSTINGDRRIYTITATTTTSETITFLG